MQLLYVSRKMRCEPAAADVCLAARTLPEMKRFVEADVHLAGRAKRRQVAQESPGDLQRARMQRTELPAVERPSRGVTQFVEVAQLRHLDEILGVAEQIDDRDDLDPDARGGGHQAGELPAAVGVAPGDARQAWVFHRVLEVKIELLIAPFRIARQPLQQKVEALHLAREVPLKSPDRQMLQRRGSAHGFNS